MKRRTKEPAAPIRTRPVFVCSVCGETVSVLDLALSSLKASGESSRQAAVLSLSEDDRVCQACDDGEADEYASYADAERLGRSDRERFEFSGISLASIEPARLQAYRLNY